MIKVSRMFLLLVFLAAAAKLSSATYFVSTTGDDLNDGLSWTTAFGSVQKGINEANSDGGGEVWVAQGTYYPTGYISDAEGQRDATDGDYYKSFSMYAGVDVYGGFFGDEATKEARQKNSADAWEFTYPTILDGQNTSYHVVWFCTNGFHDESYEGITAKLPNSLTLKAILDGFTVTGGFANYPGNIENATAPRNNIGHFSGGGVALTGLGEVNNCIVQANKAKHSGAGVSMQFNAVLYNSLIQNNEAIGAHFLAKVFFITIADFWRADGAGISARGNSTDGRPLIDNCTIHNNLAQANNNYPGTPSNAGNHNLGGGIALYFADLTNSVISSNNIKKAPYPYGGTDSGPSCGGGIYLYANGTIVNCEVTDNGFVDNDAQNGAGIFVEDYTEHAGAWTDIWVKNCYVHSNRAGGAIANDAHYSQIENCTVANNVGNGVYGYGNCNNARTFNSLIYNNSGAGWTNATNSTNNSNWLINSTVAKNGSGIGNGNTAGTYYVRNSVVWGNNSNPATPNVACEYSAFSFAPPAGTGNIQIATDNATGPMFVSPTATAGVNQAGWADAVWSVQNGSPLIDAGYDPHILSITTTDIAGNIRNQGDETDIGAYEFTLYQLSLSVDPSGSGVAVIQNNGATTGLFAPGENITITGAPNSGFAFWKWTDAGGVTISKLDEFSFAMPSENSALIAYFSENPNAPTNGLPSGSSVAVSTTQMSWTAPASGVTPTGYEIYLYSDADGYTNPIIDGLNVSGTSYNGLYLSMNTTYLAKVYAEYDPDAKGFSEPLEWYFKTENIVTYNVSVADDPDGSGIVIIQNSGSTAGDFEAGTVLDITATPQAGWNFWKWTEDGITVSIIDDFQYTVPAESVQLLAHFYQDPQAPTNGLPNGNAELVTVDTLSWSAPASGSVPTSYTVRLYSDADLYAVPIIDTEVTDTYYAPLDLEFGTSYKVKVYSNFDPDAKATSSALQWFFSTEEGSLGAPADLTISGSELNWTAVAGATGYRIYSSPDPYGTAWVLEAEVGAVTTWADPDTTPAKKFFIITAIK
ncbi:MAG: right-handed parallel beta-helix repeat-containing protein [Candidatus Delongbacteria bacterium]